MHNKIEKFYAWLIYIISIIINGFALAYNILHDAWIGIIIMMLMAAITYVIIDDIYKMHIAKCTPNCPLYSGITMLIIMFESIPFLGFLIYMIQSN